MWTAIIGGLIYLALCLIAERVYVKWAKWHTPRGNKLAKEIEDFLDQQPRPNHGHPRW